MATQPGWTIHFRPSAVAKRCEPDGLTSRCVTSVNSNFPPPGKWYTRFRSGGVNGDKSGFVELLTVHSA